MKGAVSWSGCRPGNNNRIQESLYFDDITFQFGIPLFSFCDITVIRRLYIYIYIYICVCVCVCVCKARSDDELVQGVSIIEMTIAR